MRALSGTARDLAPLPTGPIGSPAKVFIYFAVAVVLNVVVVEHLGPQHSLRRRPEDELHVRKRDIDNYAEFDYYYIEHYGEGNIYKYFGGGPNGTRQ